MRKIIFFPGLLLILILQFNCESSFTSQIEVDPSDFEARAVIYCLMVNTDERDSVFRDMRYPTGEGEQVVGNRIHISNSMPGQYSRDTFYGAHVNLRSDYQEIPLDYHSTNHSQYKGDPYYSIDGSVIPGNPYHLMVEFDPEIGDPFILKWPPVSATDTMPEPVQFVLEKADLDLAENEKEGTAIEGYIDVIMNDEPGRSNLYKVEIAAVPEFDPNVDNHQSSLAGVIFNPGNRVDDEIFGSFPDDIFEEKDFSKDGRKRIYFNIQDQQKTLKIGESARILVRITNLSENYIRYLRSIRQYYANQDNPFTEPVEIYTNVENGYGIFATAARSYGEIEIN